jgi:hypothetical protein
MKFRNICSCDFKFNNLKEIPNFRFLKLIKILQLRFDGIYAIQTDTLRKTNMQKCPNIKKVLSDG